MHWCARQGRARRCASASWCGTVTLHGGCRRRTLLSASGLCAKEPHFPKKLLRSRTYAQAARRGLSARQEVPEVEAPVHPAPHQAQQGAQEDRVLPQVAAAQICDGLEGVNAAHLQARTPGGKVVLQLSRTEEGRVKHGDVSSAAGPCEELTTLCFQSTSAAHQLFGLSRKTLGRTPRLAARFPASNLGSKNKGMGKIKLFPTPEYSSKQPSDPVVPLVPCTGIFLGPSKSGKTVTGASSKGSTSLARPSASMTAGFPSRSTSSRTWG